MGAACTKTTINTVKIKPVETESGEILPEIEASDAVTFIKNTDLRIAIK